MASSTESLTDAELDALVATAREFKPEPGHYEGTDPFRLVRWLLATGMHPCVLADPEGRRVRVETDANGLTYARWNRPKKVGIASATEAILGSDGDECAWAREFVLSLFPPRSEQTYLRLVRELGRAAGIRGTVTPRTLRHTYLTLLARRTGDPSEVIRFGNVSPRVAIQYVRGASKDRDVELARRMKAGDRIQW